MRLVLKAEQLGFSFGERKEVQRPGSRGGVGYYDAEGKWQYGERSAPAPAPTHETILAESRRQLLEGALARYRSEKETLARQEADKKATTDEERVERRQSGRWVVREIGLSGFVPTAFHTKREAAGYAHQNAAVAVENTRARINEAISDVLEYGGTDADFDAVAPAVPPAPAATSAAAGDGAHAARLRKRADAMTAQIEAKLDPAIGHQNVTMRRAGIAANMATEGRHLQERQQVLRNLADLVEAGEMPEVLRGITSRPVLDDVLRHEFVVAAMHLTHLRDLAQGALKYADLETEGVKLNALVGRSEGATSHRILMTPDEVQAAERVGKRMTEDAELKSWGKPSAHWWNDIKSHRRLVGAGIDTPEKWAEAHALVRGMVGERQETAEEKIKRLDRGLLGKEWAGYFPTPRPLADAVVAAAGIAPGMRVLEPSAGKGDLAEAIRDAGGEVKGIEIVSDLAAVAEAKGFDVTRADFMELGPNDLGVFDRVVMNPPYEGGADIDHVMHAYEFVKPGGRLVSLMSSGPFFRQDKKASSFRDWLGSRGGESRENPAGSFAYNPTSDRTTGVNTCMVTIDKSAPLAKAYPRLVIKAGAPAVKQPGSRGGKGYYDPKGEWQYGERPTGSSRTSRLTVPELQEIVEHAHATWGQEANAARMEILMHPHVYKVWQKMNPGYEVKRISDPTYGPGFIVQHHFAGSVIPWNSVHEHNPYGHKPSNAWNGIWRETRHQFMDNLYVLAANPHLLRTLGDDPADGPVRVAQRYGLKVVGSTELPPDIPEGTVIERVSGERVTVTGIEDDELLVRTGKGKRERMGILAVRSGRAHVVKARLISLASRHAALTKDLLYIDEDDLPAVDGRTDNAAVLAKAAILKRRGCLLGELVAVDEALRKAAAAVPPPYRVVRATRAAVVGMLG